MKTITIQVPDDYKPDDCEVRIVKKKKPEIRTYQDLIDNSKYVSGFYIDKFSCVTYANGPALKESKNTAISGKVARSMLAMAMISQLMPYYGGAITDEEWDNGNIIKYVIKRVGNKINIGFCYNNSFHFLAFHSEKQCNEFLKYNEQLVKVYLMID